MTCCTKCQGLLRVDGYGVDLAVTCMNCGSRTYAPFVPYVLSVERLEQAKWCKNCGNEPVVTNKSLGSKCLGARIKQGQMTGKRPFVRRE